MAADRASVVPAQWLTVLDAVADACADDRSSSVPTGRVSLQIGRGHDGTARAVLRVLRRRGYVYTTGESVDGAPLQWGLTPSGRAICGSAGLVASERDTDLSRRQRLQQPG
jgi:hypothetical protein